MTKAELINSIAAKVDCTKKEADTALNAVIGAITEALEKGDKVAITGFGTFEVRERGSCIHGR